ncbi:MAG: T9SS type A sorting domain-containing protein [candidate division WOR-3 bacterium]|nr:MAG: T9SS type A sorting domain-containing protein [candidate division WOR-3 bacterium]
MRMLVLLLVFLASAPALPSWQDDAALRDSLSQVHPRLRASWLKERGIRDEYWQGCVIPQDSGLRCIGRWSFGPSYDVDGCATPTDTLVALARGSGVSLLRFSRTDTVELEVLSDVNAGGLMKRVAVRDSLLYIGSTAGLEIWDIADVRSPRQLSWLHTALNDFDVVDTLAYVIGPDDSFKVYSVAEVGNPVFLGACCDSGYVISVCNGYAYIGDRWGLYVVDARDPANLHRVASWGTDIISVAARNTICCATTDNPNNPGELRFTILNVQTPSSPTPLGSLTGTGGYDMQFEDTLAFISGYYTGGHEFQVLSIADSLHPRLIGEAPTPGENKGVWSCIAGGRAFVADRAEGLAVFDISRPDDPVLDTALLDAGWAHDVSVRGSLVVVADDWSGVKILDASSPAQIREIGAVDSTLAIPATHTVALQDSFVFTAWNRPPYLRSVWVGDSTRPEMAGGCDGVNLPEDLSLCDTLLYVAAMRRFWVVNVARPREPVLVGSCVTQDGVRFGLAVQDTFAYLMSGQLQIINVAWPDAPTVVSSNSVGGATGVAVRDTFVYVPYGYDTLRVFSAADPTALRLLGYAPLQTHAWDVALAETTAAVATFNGLELFGLEDPSQPQRRGAVATPYGPRRVVYAAPYFYTAMWDAGVSIYAVESVGVSEGDRMAVEQPTGPSVCPNPAQEACVLAAGNRSIESITVRDVAGRVVMEESLAPATERRQLRLDLSHIGSGVYFIEVDTGSKVTSIKLVKQ